MEIFCKDLFDEAVEPFDIVQASQSLSAILGTIPVLHFRLEPTCAGQAGTLHRWNASRCRLRYPPASIGRVELAKAALANKDRWQPQLADVGVAFIY